MAIPILKRIRNRRSGFSMMELLLCIFALSMLMTVIVSSGRKVKQSTMSTICMNNLRQISIAMASYYNDYKDYPRGLPYGTLRSQLKNYVPDTGVFVCPLDNMEEEDSYSQYYVYRSEQLEKMKYTIGCPRHKSEKESFSIFSLGRTARGRVSKVMVDSVPVPLGSVCTGTITLEDGTTITSSEVSMLIIQSFRMVDGRLYTIIRALDAEEGTIDVQATPGTDLEIVTPSLIAAVRGTAYTVSVGYYKIRPVAEVSVSDGEVGVSPLNGFMVVNNHWSGAGRQSINLYTGMNLTIYGQELRVDRESIENRLVTMQRKIDKGIAANQDMSRDIDLYTWLARFVDMNLSEIPWIEETVESFVPDDEVPDFVDPEFTPPEMQGNESMPVEEGGTVEEPPAEEEEEVEEESLPEEDEWLIWLWWLLFGGGP